MTGGGSSEALAALIAAVRARVLALPEVASWPEMVDQVDRLERTRPMSSLEYPLLAAEAVGAARERAFSASAAVFCAHISIHLVDDMLDADPAGLYRRLGEATTANLALAFQAASLRVIDDSRLTPAHRAAIYRNLAAMALATAFGQDQDLRSPEGEQDYWRVVRHKTPPLFGAALHAGALLGGATLRVAGQLERLGREIGTMIQVNDDLSDALQVPAGPDWQRRSINLPILYALTADHPERSRFLSLVPRVERPEALAEAQEILVRSGAMSYCCFHVIEQHRRAHQRLEALALPRPGPLAALIDHHVEPLKRLFERIGVTSADQLFAPAAP